MGVVGVVCDCNSLESAGLGVPQPEVDKTIFCRGSQQPIRHTTERDEGREGFSEREILEMFNPPLVVVETRRELYGGDVTRVACQNCCSR